jgi:hypothetical protein
LGTGHISVLAQILGQASQIQNLQRELCLKFNSKNSKVMVIGKKIDKLKWWDLGNDQIEETNVYKYLIGSHPNTDRRADFEKLIFVFKIIFPAW